MSDDVTPTPTPDPAPAPKPAAPAPKNDDLPDWARDQITKANQEAANNRVKLREVERERDSLAEKVSTLSSEKSGLESTYSERQGDFDKLVTAVQTLFPDKPQVFSFAKTLQGSNEEELSAHAAELKEMFGLSNAPSPATDRSQGHGGEANREPHSEFAALLNSQLTR